MERKRHGVTERPQRYGFDCLLFFIWFISEGQTSEAVVRLHSSLFHLLVIFANENDIVNDRVTAKVSSSKQTSSLLLF